MIYEISEAIRCPALAGRGTVRPDEYEGVSDESPKNQPAS
jgi:hypothetical protein